MTSAELLETALHLRAMRDEHRRKGDEHLKHADDLEQASRYLEQLVAERTNAAASALETISTLPERQREPDDIEKQALYGRMGELIRPACLHLRQRQGERGPPYCADCGAQL